jgi:hypothetical protein
MALEALRPLPAEPLGVVQGKAGEGEEEDGQKAEHGEI